MWMPPPPRSDRRTVHADTASPPASPGDSLAPRLPSLSAALTPDPHVSSPLVATWPTRMAAASGQVRPRQFATSPLSLHTTTRRRSPPVAAPVASFAADPLVTWSLAVDEEAQTSAKTTRARTRARTRPLTNSERGRQFRLREKVHEQNLIQQLKQLRLQIAQLESSQHLVKQRMLNTRTESGGSLERITRELYSVFQFGLENHHAPVAAVRNNTSDHRGRSSLSVARAKENFLCSVVDQDVEYGDLVGVEALIDQWRRHTASYSRFEIEINHVEPIAGSEANPIVVIHTKLHARFSRETLPIMFPFVVERRPDLASKFINRDITFHCISRFTFSKRDQITTYMVDVNFVEALVKTVGSARDVAELMGFSLVTPLMTFRDVEQLVQPLRYPSSTESISASPGVAGAFGGDDQVERNEWRGYGADGDV